VQARVEQLTGDVKDRDELLDAKQKENMKVKWLRARLEAEVKPIVVHM
jgi:hypothetical protein